MSGAGDEPIRGDAVEAVMEALRDCGGLYSPELSARDRRRLATVAVDALDAAGRLA
jgi:hypothetical protein